MTGDGATITGNTVIGNVGSGIIVNGANSNITGNNVNYNGGTGILVNGVEVTGNGTYNGLLVSGPSLLSFLALLGVDITLPAGVEATISAVLATVDEIGVVAVDIAAAIDAAGGFIGLVSNPIGWAVAFAIADAYLTQQYPDLMVPANLKSIPIVGIGVSLYALQSEIRGDGDPLTPERLQEDYWKGVNLIIEISDSEDYKDIRKEIKEKAEKGDFNGVQDIIDNVAGLGGIPGDPRTNDDYKNWGEKIHEDWDEFVNALKRGDVGSAAENGLILSIETGTYPLAVTGEVIVDYYNKMTGRT